MSKNEHTGDVIATKATSDAYRSGYDAIYGITCRRCGKRGLHPNGVHTCSPQIREPGNTGSSLLEEGNDHPD